MKKTIIAGVALVAVIIVLIIAGHIIRKSGVQKNQSTPDSYAQTAATGAETTPAAEKEITPSIQTKTMNPHITLVTNKGNIEIELSADATPKTVENFIALAEKNFYDNTKFHRIIEGFMIQGGDPLSKDDAMMARWGTGGPGYQFNDEITAANKNNRGTISMANAGPNTNGSQFFINLVDNNFLDTKHTVFGKVVKGMEVVDAIGLAATGANDRPTEAIIITDVTVQK